MGGATHRALLTRASPAWRFAAIAGTIAAAWLLLSPASASPDVPSFPAADKLYHALLFASLGVAWGMATRRPAWTVFGGLVLFAAATEVAQLGIPGRSADVVDLLVDALGATASFVTGRRSPT